MAAYIIVQANITDKEEYKEYRKRYDFYKDQPEVI